ncbi:aromatic ring-hydroxylating dioxygenase subunit alpha [Methyloligella sp. 2.7D]|uniref:aromatic ring-hydroxylating oxygenase subunit alpha n=1 Tax=unclassified Methyloligella TaxID=2625955 RepID=UPI00157E2644|nr:aromatic ring-hydroxylating dioxygenase subunit alpha [Methyloligella sp. GL2]QKP76229.1 aromatic ring-hydroxylating dioxygenase subunit alpha [Methyloligella sp. GL2]
MSNLNDAPRSDEKLNSLVADIIETAALPLKRASTLPAAAYTDEDYFQLEKEKILAAGWMCIAHVSQLKEPGDYVAVDLLDEPMMAVRDREGEIRVLSRVCAHRSIDILPEEMDIPREGQKSVFVCPYHSWAYNLDGSLRGCPQMQNAEGFDKSDWRLATFRSEIWNGFVFVNLDGKAEPLCEQYADFGTAIAPWNAHEMEVVIELEWECNFNWKVMIENWMESYHHIGAHSQTLNVSMPGQFTWSSAEQPHFIHAHLPFTDKVRAEVQDLAKGGEKASSSFTPVEGLSEQQLTEWSLFVGFPCFMFLAGNDRTFWYRLLPISAERCKLMTTTLVSKKALEAPDFAETVKSETEMLREFHTEDMLMNVAVQRGLHSSKVVRGRLSHLEEPIWLIQRHVAARLQDGFPQRADRAPYYGPFAATAAE